MENRIDQYDKCTYKKFTKKSELDKAIHTLEGILKGISIDKDINEKEINELLAWCECNESFLKAKPIKELIQVIRNCIEDGIIDENEKEDLLWLCKNYRSHNTYYDVITADIQILQGLLHGILADGVITNDEIRYLSEWIGDNDHLVGIYPYDEINGLLTSILLDGKIDEHERNMLKLFFSEFIDTKNSINLDIEELNKLRKELSIDGICAVCPTISLNDKVFCFTGTSSKTTRKEIDNLITSLGGSYNDRLTQKTDYLVIGNEGNKCWAFSCYGRKVEQAVALRKKGHTIMIIHENDFWDAIEDLG